MFSRRVNALAALVIGGWTAWSGAAPASAPPPRVIVLSWDGAAFWITARLLAEGHLPHLQALVREGAWSDGMITSFPTKTAAAHALLWTGHHGHASGITGNHLLADPPEEHSRLERESGYFSGALRVEPVWVKAARARRTTYTLHATQSYPFERQVEALDARTRQHLRMLYGYPRRGIPPEVLSPERAPLAPARDWRIPEGQSPAAREIEIRAGEATLWGLFFDDPVDPREGLDTLGIAKNKNDRGFLARMKSGANEPFSAPVPVEHRGGRLFPSFRLFELDPEGAGFLLYRSGAEPVLLSTTELPGAGEIALEAFAGNGAHRAYRDGELGPTLAGGGDGRAEERYLETVAHVSGQLRAQAERVLRAGDYHLAMFYTPFPDEAAHVFVGHLDPALPGHDPELARKIWPRLLQAFALQDELLGSVMEIARRDRAHLLLVSDHGLAGTDRTFNVNVALARAGLLGLTPDRRIDLSTTRALYLPLDDGSVAVNTTGRRGGIVPPAQRAAVLAEVRRVLGQARHPETGEHLLKSFFEPSRRGLLQPGGERTGDLFLDPPPGVYLSDQTIRDEIVSPTPPVGSHLFNPTRREMLAILGAWGPRVAPGTRWGRVQATDVTPTILDLLELPPAAELEGRSLLPEKLLIQNRCPCPAKKVSGFGQLR